MSRSRTAAALCAATITAGLLFGSGVAQAADADDPLCVTLAARVDALPALEAANAKAVQVVADAQAEVATAQAQVPPDPYALIVAESHLADANDAASNASGALATAQTAVSVAQTNVTGAGLDCTDTGDPEPTEDPDPTQDGPTSEPEPTGEPEPTTPPVTTTPASVVLTDDRDCDDFDTQDAAQGYYLSRRTVAQPDPDRLDSNGNGIACEGPAVGDAAVDTDEPAQTTTVAPPATSVVVNGDVTVNPLDDDDSTADTDGTQVTIVPQGSASTGA